MAEPCDLQFLNEAVNELNNSLLTGVQVGSVKYSSDESMPSFIDSMSIFAFR